MIESEPTPGPAVGECRATIRDLTAFQVQALARLAAQYDEILRPRQRARTGRALDLAEPAFALGRGDAAGMG